MVKVKLNRGKTKQKLHILTLTKRKEEEKKNTKGTKKKKESNQTIKRSENQH